MRKIMQQEKEMPVASKIAQERQVQPGMNNMHWFHRRYDYYCGDWQYNWHEKRKVEHRNGGATIIAPTSLATANSPYEAYVELRATALA